MIVKMEQDGYTIKHGLDIERVPADYVPSDAVYNRIESASCRYAVHFYPGELIGGNDPMAIGSETAILTAARPYIPFSIFNGLRRTEMTLEYTGAINAWWVNVTYSNIVREIWDVSVTCNQENVTTLRTDGMNNVQDYPVSGYETTSFNGWIGISSGGIQGIERQLSTFNYRLSCSVPFLQTTPTAIQSITTGTSYMLNCVNANDWRGWNAKQLKLVDYSIELSNDIYNFSFTWKSDYTETMSLPGNVSVTRGFHQGFQALPLEQITTIGNNDVTTVTPIRYQTFDLYGAEVNFETILTSVTALYGMN